MDEHRISGGRLEATIRSLGAELISLAHVVSGDVLWPAGPAWPRHAPVLFPIVGDLAHDAYELNGKTYSLGRHGFARTSAFAWTRRDANACELTLVENDVTLAVYPFRFELTLGYAIDGDALAISYAVRNPGTVPLPASLGGHPAFRWPLTDGVPKDAHALTFSCDEPEPIRRLDKRLLGSTPFPTPIRGNVLALDPSLFDADAIVMDRPLSTSVRYGAPGTPSVDVAWKGFEQLGIWSAPGGDFVCIEPWFGYASPSDFSGDFTTKPGLMHVAPGETRTFGIHVTVTPPA